MPPRQHLNTKNLGHQHPNSSEHSNLRAQLNALKQDHQQFDHDQNDHRAQMRKQREERIQGHRRQAAENLGIGGSSNSGNNKNNNNNKAFMAILILTISFVLGFFFIYASRFGFFVSDSICSIRRVTSTVGKFHKNVLRQAVQDSFSANVHSAEHNRTLFWGTYRPNVLAGVKSRESEPLLFGIAWWDSGKKLPVRHTAEDGEEVFFRWDAHDGRWYGREHIEDRQLGIKLRVRFAKNPNRDGWVMNLEGERVGTAQRVPITFAVYFASEHKNSNLGIRSRFSTNSPTAPIGLSEGAFSKDSKLLLSGNIQSYNGKRFAATVEDLRGDSNQESQWNVFALSNYKNNRKEGAWKINFHNDLRGSARLAEHHLVAKTGQGSPIKSATSIVMTKKIVNDFRFDITLKEQDTLENEYIFQDSCVNEVLFNDLEESFNERFEAVFEMSEHFENLKNVFPEKFSSSSSSSSFSSARTITAESFLTMTKSGLSNLLGGIGYWHGDYLVQTKAANPRRGVHHQQPVIETHGPRSLFSGVPSRAKFPRGFLWDEGFHQLLVHHWDRALSEDVLLHWLVGVMEPNGWIPREQILGPESRTRVPDQFIPQHPEHTNPPAMILVLQGMLLDARRGEFGKFSSSENEKESSSSSSNDNKYNSGSSGGGGVSEIFSNKALPQLGKWFKFLISSQCGGDPKTCTKTIQQMMISQEHQQYDASHKKELEQSNTTFMFRWRSRNGYHLLASGLDDYPRPTCKPNQELHVDLFSWVHMMSKTMRMLEELAAASPENREEIESQQRLPHLIVSDDAWRKWLIKLHWDSQRKQFSDVRGGCIEKTKHFSHFFGYINLFPLLTLSLDTEEREYVLEIVRKAKSELSGGKGLQSLSNKTRRYLDKHDDYWTGPIWINVNFLFLRALKRKYIAIGGPEVAQVYDEVRRDVLANVGKVFAETGKLWENYDLSTGKGRGTAPFTGWTTLVILIAAEKY